MQFAHPLFLFALFALAIPILIHLFNFRRFKKVYFTNVRFLTDLQQESKRKSKLKQLLILAARLLTLTCLVIAFSQPYLSSSVQQKQKAGKRAISIYIDNSFSMEALATEGRLIDIAKSKANEIAQYYKPSDIFQLLTNDFEGRHQRFYSREEFTKLVEEVRLSPVSRSLSTVIRRQNDLLTDRQNMAMNAFLISDFQKSSADILFIKPEPSCSWYFVPIAPQHRNNLYIDTISFESLVHRPNQMVRLKIHICNYGNESLEKIPIKLTINNIQKAVASFSVESNSTTEVILPYTENDAGIQFGTLDLIDYPVQYDDQFFFSYSIFPKIPVLCINGASENQYLNALFKGDSSFYFINLFDKKLDYTSFGNYNMIILNSLEEIPSGLVQELTEFSKLGGSLVIFPPLHMNSDSYRTFLSAFSLPSPESIDTTRQPITSIALESELYKDVFEKNSSGKVILPENADFPLVTKYYRQSKNLQSDQEPLLKLLNGQPFLTLTRSDKGKVYLFSIPLEDSWSSFPRHLLFVPTLFQMAYLSNPVKELYYLIGSNEIPLPFDSLNGKNLLKIRQNDDGAEFIPGSGALTSRMSLLIQDQVKKSGLYTLLSGKRPIEGIAFNYNRSESNLKTFSESEIKKQLSRHSSGNIHLLPEKKTSLAKQIQNINQGAPLWKLFLILALVFIASEIFLIRLIKG